MVEGRYTSVSVCVPGLVVDWPWSSGLAETDWQGSSEKHMISFSFMIIIIRWQQLANFLDVFHYHAKKSYTCACDLETAADVPAQPKFWFVVAIFYSHPFYPTKSRITMKRRSITNIHTPLHLFNGLPWWQTCTNDGLVYSYCNNKFEQKILALSLLF